MKVDDRGRAPSDVEVPEMERLLSRALLHVAFGSFGYYNVGYGDWRYTTRHIFT